MRDVVSVYVMGKPGGPCKVGISSSARARLPSVQTGCPFEITVVEECRFTSRTIAAAFESEAHHLLKSMGLHLHGDWFDIDPSQIMADIRLVSAHGARKFRIDLQ